MKQYTEIADVPTDIEVVDSMGFTWENRGGVWGYKNPSRGPLSDWTASLTVAAGKPTAYMGPFAEVR